jgi:hypothetical protein
MLFARRNSGFDVQMLTRELDHQLLQPLFQKYSAHPPQIAHYTTVDTLDAILSTGNLRMTHFRFLNDSTEMLHGRRIINEILGAEARTGDQTAGFFDYSRFLFNEVGDDAIQCFVTSFSMLTDAADLWARYGARCSGVAISFDTHRMGAKKNEPAPYYVGRITYTAEEQSVARAACGRDQDCCGSLRRSIRLRRQRCGGANGGCEALLPPQPSFDLTQRFRSMARGEGVADGLYRPSK